MNALTSRRLALAAALIVHLALGRWAWSQSATVGCEWTGPSIAWILEHHLPPGGVAGLLGSDVVPFLQSQGVPVSFVSAASDSARIEAGSATTVREVLSEIERQAPGYRYRDVDGRLVIYSRDPAYDSVVDLGPTQKIVRGGAYFFVLRP
jgi:hypothetical protein